MDIRVAAGSEEISVGSVTSEESRSGRPIASSGPGDELIARVLQLKRWRRYTCRALVSSCIFLACTLIAAMIAYQLLPPWQLILLIDAGCFACVWMFVNLFSDRHRNAIIALAEGGDVSAIGILLDAMVGCDGRQRQVVRDALVRLLPLLRQTDVHLLTIEHRRQLTQYLLPDAPEKADALFIAAILKGLEQVGGEPFIGVVDGLAQGRGAGIHPRVRIAAEECLPNLRQLVDRRNASRELLRGAAETPYTQPEILLRAAAMSGEARSDELLRPHINGQGR